jgi:hypothetical protein
MVRRLFAGLPDLGPIEFEDDDSEIEREPVHQLPAPPVLVQQDRAGLRHFTGPCFNQWRPQTCETSPLGPTVDHVCWRSRAYPHVCVCARCGGS